MLSENEQEIKNAIALLKKEAQTNFIAHLIHNPGNVHGYNEEAYLKNDAWNRKRNKAAKRAICILEDVLSF